MSLGASHIKAIKKGIHMDNTLLTASTAAIATATATTALTGQRNWKEIKIDKNKRLVSYT